VIAVVLLAPVAGRGRCIVAEEAHPANGVWRDRRGRIDREDVRTERSFIASRQDLPPLVRWGW